MYPVCWQAQCLVSEGRINTHRENLVQGTGDMGNGRLEKPTGDRKPGVGSDSKQ